MMRTATIWTETGAQTRVTFEPGEGFTFDPKPGVDLRVEEVFRVVLHDSRGRVQLSIDLEPSRSSVTLIDKYGAGFQRLVVVGALRSALGTQSTHPGLCLVLRAWSDDPYERGVPEVRVFRINGTDTVDEGPRAYRHRDDEDFVLERFRPVAITDPGDEGTPPSGIGKELELRNKKIASLAEGLSDVEKALGIKFDGRAEVTARLASVRLEDGGPNEPVWHLTTKREFRFVAAAGLPELPDKGCLVQRPPMRSDSSAPGGMVLDDYRAGHVVLIAEDVAPIADFADVWSRLVQRPYAAALAAVAAGRPVSMVPKWSFEVPQNPGGVALVGDAVVPPPGGGRPLAGSWRALEATRPEDVTGSFPNLLRHDGQPVQWLGRLAPRSDPRPDLNGPGNPEDNQCSAIADPLHIYLGIGSRGTKAPSGLDEVAATAKKVRLGALDLALPGAPIRGLSCRAVLRADPVQPESSVPVVDIEADLDLTTFAPAGQDPLPAEERVSEGESELRPDGVDRFFRRAEPLVYLFPSAAASHATKAGAPTPFHIVATEKTMRDRSQTLRLRLRQRGQWPSTYTRLLVVDTEPMFVGRIDLRDLYGGEGARDNQELGNWSNVGSEGARWEIFAGADGFSVVLPPQAVGEAMEKGRSAQDIDDVEEGELVDYRFSTAARLELLSSYYDQAFAEAPWNLRRILGYPGQRAPGSRVLSLHFEVFYGLCGSIDAPNLMLSEIGARSGAWPPRLGQDLRSDLADMEEALEAQLVERYNAHRCAWGKVYRRLMRRLAVLEPWSAAQPSALKLEEGVRFELRPEAEPRFPVPDGVAAEGVPAHGLGGKKDGFAGGATWGFESSSIYNAVWRDPTSTRAAIAKPMFSALGGWAQQRASFDNDRTTIFASTAMGRTHYVALERIGRIAAWWTPAKHVIIYERTVRRARQFDDQQDEHLGRGVLRKVREYVEILEPERSYPEFGADPMTRGFVEKLVWRQKIINVDGRWGRDIGQEGWAVPLWRTDLPDDLADIYPRPDVAVAVSTDPESGAELDSLRIGNPENLYFYTSVRPDLDSRTDLWPSVWGVDFADVVPPRENPDLTNRQLRRPRAPSAPSRRTGSDRFTFLTEPGTRPTNLNATRSESPIGARLRSISFMRAPGSGVAAASLRPVQKAVLAAARIRGSSGRALEEVLEVLRDAEELSDVQKPVTEAIERAARDLDQVQDWLSALKTAEFDVFEKIDPCAEADRRVRMLVRNEGRRSFGELADLRRSIATLVEPLEGKATWDEVGDTRNIFRARVNDLFGELGFPERIAGADANLDQLSKRLEGVPEKLEGAADAFVAVLESTKQTIVDAPECEAKEFALEELGYCRDRADELFNEVQSLVQPLDTWSNGRMDGPRRVIESAQSSLRAGFVDLAKAIQEANDASTLKADAAVILDQLVKTVEGVHRDANGTTGGLAKAVEDFRGTLADVPKTTTRFFWDAISAGANELLKDVGGQQPTPDAVYEGLTALIRARLSEAAIEAQLAEAEEVAAERARAVCEALLETPQKVFQHLKQLKLGEQLRRLFAALEGRADAAAKVLARFAKDIDAELERFLESVGEELGQARRAVEESIGLGDRTARLFRAFGEPPRIPGMGFNRKFVEFGFDEFVSGIEMTPVAALVRTGEAAVDDAINALGIRLPTRQLLDRLVPSDLPSFDLASVFPNFAGLELEKMFRGVKLPALANDGIKVTHGIEEQTLRAWVQADVDVDLGGQQAILFSLGPVTVRANGARFQAKARTETVKGRVGKQSVTGVLTADWEVAVGGLTLVVFRRTSLTYDESGDFEFDLSPDRVELQAGLQFISTLLDSIGYSEGGFSLGMLPLPRIGVQSTLALPLPDLQGGGFAISNLDLFSAFRLEVTPKGVFEVMFSLDLARKSNPFVLTVSMLGGGGWVNLEASYRTTTGAITTCVQIGIVAAAAVGINLGPIRGGVMVAFGVYGEFFGNSRAGSSFSVAFVVVIDGHVSLKGIVSVHMNVTLEARYDSNGGVTGRGTYSVKIKICRFFTLKVRRSIRYQIAKGSSTRSTRTDVDYDSAASRYLRALD